MGSTPYGAWASALVYELFSTLEGALSTFEPRTRPALATAPVHILTPACIVRLCRPPLAASAAATVTAAVSAAVASPPLATDAAIEARVATSAVTAAVTTTTITGALDATATDAAVAAAVFAADATATTATAAATTAAVAAAAASPQTLSESVGLFLPVGTVPPAPFYPNLSAPLLPGWEPLSTFLSTFLSTLYLRPALHMY